MWGAVSNISDLKAALIAEAAKLSDTLQQLEVLSLIDDWYSCRVAVAAVQANGIASYSIGGRSVTRQNVDTFAQQERVLYAEIMGHLRSRGGGLLSIADASEGPNL